MVLLSWGTKVKMTHNIINHLGLLFDKLILDIGRFEGSLLGILKSADISWPIGGKCDTHS